MAISSGIGSGLDVNSLVTQLVAAERAPTDQRFARIETTTKAQISAFGALRAALAGLDSTLKSLDGDGALPSRKVNVQADAGFAATAGPSARLGRYAISVERLASAQKLQSAPVAKDTQVGNGRLTITVGTDAPILVDIASGKGTLSDIRDAINQAAGGNGVSATLVHGDAGDVLVMASTKTGSAGALNITASGGDGGLGVLATSGGTLTEVVPASDAQIRVDGTLRTTSSNTINNAIDGITLNLSKAAPGTAFTLEISPDASPLKASLLGFISAYNTTLSQLRTQGAAGGEGKAAGALSGDSAPRSITQSLRQSVTNGYGALSTLGFKTAVDGSLSLDGAKFDTAIAADPEAVNRLLGAGGSLGTSLRTATKAFIADGGTITTRSTALNGRIKSLQRQRDAFQVRIDNSEAAYRRQFSALDALMTKMQGTSSFLSQQLSALPSSN